MTPLDRRLTFAGAATKDAEDARSRASHLLRQAIITADKEGYGPTRIAKTAGVSRQTVHRILREG